MRLIPFLITSFSLLITGACFGQDTDNESAPVEKAQPAISKYKSVLSFSPMQFSENGVGIAFAYERALDKDGVVAVYLPVITTVDISRNFGNGSHHQNDGMVYVAPGLKFYPTGCFGRVKYALGPSIVVGVGTQTEYPAYYYYNTYSKFVLGVIVSNSLNINVTDHVYLGMDLGLGFTYVNTWDGNRRGMAALTQGGFKIGYRF